MNLRVTTNLKPFHTFILLPVLSWRFTDAAGHVHGFTGDEISWSLPTLNWVVYQEGDDEHLEQGHYECKQCHATIKPEFASQPSRVFFEHRGRSYFIDEQPVSFDQYMEAVKQMAAERIPVLEAEILNEIAHPSETRLQKLRHELAQCQEQIGVAKK